MSNNKTIKEKVTAGAQICGTHINLSDNIVSELILFGDLMLSGLMGIGQEDGELKVQPLIPDSWDYFKVENLHFRGKTYTITFDRNGTYYGNGKGIVIR